MKLGGDVSSTKLHILSRKFGQQLISITTGVITVLSHEMLEVRPLDYLCGTCFLGHPVYIVLIIYWSLKVNSLHQVKCKIKFCVFPIML